ncbi:iron chaperone [Amycolatopsis aidingensis]|uniref:iron chaperone n=1 Tax=Amycolatopsis aidingensis TaxID=2842453 RepID=UPI001C0DA812|nr:DUF1801 domain-containing protein [Amycolatopsis aidingensis]
MHSAADDVDEYLARVPEERREALARLRSLCREELPGFTERMAYGMPSYQRDGTTDVGFASQKQYISIYLLRTDVLAAHADRLAGADRGKGCLRYRRPDAIDFELLRSMLRATAATRGEVC